MATSTYREYVVNPGTPNEHYRLDFTCECGFASGMLTMPVPRKKVEAYCSRGCITCEWGAR